MPETHPKDQNKKTTKIIMLQTITCQNVISLAKIKKFLSGFRCFTRLHGCACRNALHQPVELPMNIRSAAILALSVIASSALAAESRDRKCGAGTCGKKTTSASKTPEAGCSKKSETEAKDASCSKKDASCSKKEASCSKKDAPVKDASCSKK